MSEWHEWLASKGVEVRSRAPARYVRRANNQVSADLEAVIRDFLSRGWTKTAIARAFRVNRRVVIRVAREAGPKETVQSAQCAGERSPNGMENLRGTNCADSWL
jgi:DNA invertase Pin-like site-specific DNA recombinase